LRSSHSIERFAEELAISKAETEIDQAKIIAEDDDQHDWLIVKIVKTS